MILYPILSHFPVACGDVRIKLDAREGVPLFQFVQWLNHLHSALEEIGSFLYIISIFILNWHHISVKILIV